MQTFTLPSVFRAHRPGMDQAQVLKGLDAGDRVVVYSEKALGAQPHARGRAHCRGLAMISLAGRDILQAWGKFIFTGVGLGPC